MIIPIIESIFMIIIHHWVLYDYSKAIIPSLSRSLWLFQSKFIPESIFMIIPKQTYSTTESIFMINPKQTYSTTEAIFMIIPMQAYSTT